MRRRDHFEIAKHWKVLAKRSQSQFQAKSLEKQAPKESKHYQFQRLLPNTDQSDLVRAARVTCSKIRNSCFLHTVHSVLKLVVLHFCKRQTSGVEIKSKLPRESVHTQLVNRLSGLIPPKQLFPSEADFFPQMTGLKVHFLSSCDYQNHLKNFRCMNCFSQKLHISLFYNAQLFFDQSWWLINDVFPLQATRKYFIILEKKTWNERFENLDIRQVYFRIRRKMISHSAKNYKTDIKVALASQQRRKNSTKLEKNLQWRPSIWVVKD